MRKVQLFGYPWPTFLMLTLGGLALFGALALLIVDAPRSAAETVEDAGITWQGWLVVGKPGVGSNPSIINVGANICVGTRKDGVMVFKASPIGEAIPCP